MCREMLLTRYKPVLVAIDFVGFYIRRVFVDETIII